MRFWKQVLICLVVLVAGFGLWVKFVPGAGTTLAAIGISNPLIDSLTKPADKQGSGQGDGQGRGQGAGGGPVRVVTKPVSTALVNDRLNAIGNGEAIRSVTVTPSATGNLSEVLVQSGDKVSQGQVIARLDSDEQRIAADQARLTRKSAAEKVERYKNLGSASAVTAVEKRDAQTALETAELALQAAELTLTRREVIAPSSGVVGIIAVNPGDYVTTSTPIATIDDRSEILVDFFVPERFARNMVVGKEISATAISEPGKVLTGSIHAIDNRIDQASRTLRVRAKIANLDDTLRAGMSFSVTVKFDGDRYPTVDPLAIQWSSDGSFVWRVAGDKSLRVPVKIIQRNPDKVLVQAEIAEGETVVTEGVQRLRDGGAVAVAGAKPAEKVSQAETAQ
ncbi:efflux RND transporter periplasmic adaptor subunit [Pararhizobium sp.]|uniref:efflux RND transporter periplasmic adaptor subunit n=1 Tax=Pararhizobium sp. TaxID=1977563 RepID=UPI0027261D6F|nr:efflux RND transporter periplasmic adaptor subunit [Pararhizobium sp.]MDO9418799.1 efflux RND transporter periplasmic adaptor subunit [Pararhizobium sp.]